MTREKAFQEYEKRLKKASKELERAIQFAKAMLHYQLLAIKAETPLK